MDTKMMIALVGEQPIPVLLPILHENRVNQVAHVLLVCSTSTKRVGERLKEVLQTRGSFAEVKLLCTEPYDILQAEKDLAENIPRPEGENNKPIFNLTGGTKPMALAAYALALQSKSPFQYLQSEGRRSLLYAYNFATNGGYTREKIEIPPLLDIDTYLNAYLGPRYTQNLQRQVALKAHGMRFENAVETVLRRALSPLSGEVKTSIVFPEMAGEIDLALRLGNNVGIAEIKSGKKAKSKEGINQLNTVAAPQFLGTYIAKILITDTDGDTDDDGRSLPKNIRKLAHEHRIRVIELPSFSASGGQDLSESDKNKLTSEVLRILGG